MSKTQAPDPAPRPFTAVKAFADSVLAMLDERIKAADQAAHPFNDYFGDKPETIVAAKAQAGELREVRTQVRILADRALVELMKFRPAISAPAVGAEPVRYPHPDEDDPVTLWKEIRRLRAAMSQAKCDCTAYCGQYVLHGSCRAHPAPVTISHVPVQGSEQ